MCGGHVSPLDGGALADGLEDVEEALELDAEGEGGDLVGVALGRVDHRGVHHGLAAGHLTRETGVEAC